MNACIAESSYATQKQKNWINHGRRDDYATLPLLILNRVPERRISGQWVHTHLCENCSGERIFILEQMVIWILSVWPDWQTVSLFISVHPEEKEWDQNQRNQIQHLPAHLVSAAFVFQLEKHGRSLSGGHGMDICAGTTNENALNELPAVATRQRHRLRHMKHLPPRSAERSLALTLILALPQEADSW